MLLPIYCITSTYLCMFLHVHTLWVKGGHMTQLTCVLACVQKAYCSGCADTIWGLRTQQGYKCINCKVLLHKRCHRLLPLTCPMLMVGDLHQPLLG